MVGDLGGVVVVPRGIAVDVHLKVEELFKEEDGFRGLIAGGGSYEEVTPAVSAVSVARSVPLSGPPGEGAE